MYNYTITRPIKSNFYSSNSFFSECVANEADYQGRVSVTKSGKKCQSWSSQTPHAHSFTDPNMFPDTTIGDAANYCRHIDSCTEGIWCLTTDPNQRWEECDVPRCGKILF